MHCQIFAALRMLYNLHQEVRPSVRSYIALWCFLRHHYLVIFVQMQIVKCEVKECPTPHNLTVLRRKKFASIHINLESGSISQSWVSIPKKSCIRSV